MKPVDFNSGTTELLLNPRMPEALARALKGRLSNLQELPGHVLLLTSGSTATSAADYKWVALRKSAILASAAASNRFLECSRSDIWFHTLPHFHVGGLGIWARAELSQSEVILPTYDRWNPTAFHTELVQSRATVTSLVPTQVHDLVQAQLESPASLRAILVGGSAFPEDLQKSALKLGWQVLPTYGLSETASQVATYPTPDSSQLQILDHLEARTDTENRIQVRGTSLFSGYITDQGFQDPKDNEGWFTTEDLGEVRGRNLIILGRTRDRIKIGGELANLSLLRQTFEEEAARAHLRNLAVITAVPDQRLENRIVVATEELSQELEQAKNAYNDRVLPFERIRAVHQVPKIPRTELGKVRWMELTSLLSLQ